MRRFGPVVAVAVVALSCAACGDEAVSSSPSPLPGSASGTPSPAGTPVQGGSSSSVEGSVEGGISAEEAQESGVFTADFDAMLTGPSALDAEGRAVLTLTNVGGRGDSYVVEVEGPGEVSPDEASLAPEQSLDLQVRADGPVVVHVVSEGRGAPVADLHLSR